jgi:cation-transporting P-type ATPase 13A2
VEADRTLKSTLTTAEWFELRHVEGPDPDIPPTMESGQNSRAASRSRYSASNSRNASMDEEEFMRRRSDMYRRGSNMSEASFLTDVEMAQEEMFSGPVSESVPTATSTFSYRRSRRDSTASFEFYDDDLDADSEDWTQGDEAIIDEQDELERQQSFDAADTFMEPEVNDYPEDDIESQNGHVRRPSRGDRKGSGLSKSSRGSRTSLDAPLLRRHPSGGSDTSGFRSGGRVSQKIYILTEDMTIVVAGFRTSLFGFALYLCICFLTLGAGYLILRWLPKWYVKLVGRSTALSKCDWVVIENQWGEMIVQDLKKQPFSQSLSSVF